MLLSKNKCRAAWPSAVELRGVGGAKMQDVSISNGDGLLGGKNNRTAVGAVFQLRGLSQEYCGHDGGKCQEGKKIVHGNGKRKIKRNALLGD